MQVTEKKAMGKKVNFFLKSSCVCVSIFFYVDIDKFGCYLSIILAS